MAWYKKSQKETAFDKSIKDLIKRSSFFINMFKDFGIPICLMDSNLTFKVKDMEGKHAQSDSENIYINTKLVNDDFFKKHVHFVAHELSHWLTRQREKEFYFADPEEIESFSFSMAYEMLRGKNKDEIRDVFFPMMRNHFKENSNAEKLFEALFAKALLKSKKTHETS